MDFLLGGILEFLVRWIGEGFLAVAKSIDQFMR